MIPYGRQQVTESDIEAVLQVLRSEFLTQGPAVPRFEQLVAGKVGAGHAVAVNSATSALHVACLALDLGPGDCLWTVPNSFVASANCALYCGADVDFVDIDPRTWNMSVDRLEEKLVRAEREGKLPKVVVPVHFAGQPGEQERIWELARKYQFKVLEDAAHSLGASRHGEPVGSCKWSHAAVFSFHPVKIVTSGEGGMVMTNDGALAARMRLLRSHGTTRDEADFTHPSPGPWYYEQQALGFNYRLTDIHAALGASQMARLDTYVERRNEIAARYDEALRGLPLRLPTVLSGNRSSYHLYVVRLAGGKAVNTDVLAAMRSRGIGVSLHYRPVHLQPYYRKRGFSPGSMPEAEAYQRDAMTLPLFPVMTHAEQGRVIEALAQSL